MISIQTEKGVLRTLVLLAILTMVAVCSARCEEAAKKVLPAGSRATDGNYFLPTLEAPTKGFLLPATATAGLGTSSVDLVGTLPVGTKFFRIFAFNGDVVYGDAGLSTASALTYPFVASGSLSDPIAVATTTPEIYWTGRVGSASARKICW